MKFTQNLARAAMLLLLAVLTSTGAWANEAEDLSTPLTLEAKSADATVTFYVASIAANGVEYSTDGGTTWTTIAAGGTGTITLTNADDEVLYQQRRLLDKQGEPVDAATKVEAGQYSLEAEAQPAPDSDVTPVTPE